jgi:hypothetical protein
VSVRLVLVFGAAIDSVPVPLALPWSDIALMVYPLDDCPYRAGRNGNRYTTID